MKTIFKTLFLCLLFSSSANAVDPEILDLKKYTQELIDKEYKNFNDKSVSSEEKTKNIKEFINSNFRLDWMANYALGRHRKTLEKAKIDEFCSLYSKFVTQIYLDLAKGYNGEKAELKKVKKVDDDMFIVNTEVVKPNGQPPIRVDYLVHQMDPSDKNKYLVGDIITEGVSILNSQQAEFNSVISSHGIDALISDLKNRINKSK